MHPRGCLRQHAVETLHAVEPRGVRGDRFGRATLRLPAQGLQGADIRDDVAGVAKAVVAGHPAWLIGAVLTHNDVGEFPGGDPYTATDVEDPPGGEVVLQREHVGIYDVIDVDVVADRRTVLIEGRRYALQVTQAEDATGARVRVIDRLPRSLDDAVAQGDRRDAVPATKVNGDCLLGELGHSVRVLGIGDPLWRSLHLKRAAAHRAWDIP